MQFKTKLGLVDISNEEVLSAANNIARDGAQRVPVLMNRIQELEDLLRSARCIAERKGEDTAWERFSAAIGAMGVGSITARVYKVLPDDPRPRVCAENHRPD
jgi:hypothetical protein